MQQNLARRKQPTILIPIMALVYATILSACLHGPEPLSPVVPNGNIPQGQVAIQRYGCGSCHVIPGIDGANGVVGPPLTDWRNRSYIAGRLPNEPNHLIQWIQDPQSVDPENTMPNMGVSEVDARDIAAYLYSIGRDRADAATR